MPKLNSDFPLLPADNNPNRVSIYAAVYAQLQAIGVNPPGQGPGLISHDNLLRHLQQEAGKIVKNELQKVGYNGHSDAECAALLDSALVPGPFNAPAIHDILVGFPFAPNAVTVDDVTGSKN
jgi:hypothetical protein